MIRCDVCDATMRDDEYRLDVEGCDAYKKLRMTLRLSNVCNACAERIRIEVVDRMNPVYFQRFLKQIQEEEKKPVSRFTRFRNWLKRMTV